MKQFNNKVLIIVLALLAGIFILSKVFRSPKRESNLSNAFASIDTSRVTEIRITKPHQTFKLVRSNYRWSVHQENKTASAQQSHIKSLLGSIVNVTAQKLVTRNQEKWNDYNVSDSTGMQVVILENGNTSAHWIVGKQGSSSYMRESGEDNVYAVAGSIHEDLSREYNDWRDKTFIRINKDNVSSISFHYPADSSFTLEKKESGWMAGAEKADSASVDRYLNRFASKNLSSFEDDFTPAGRAADVSIEFKNKDHTSFTVQAWKQDSVWILTSSYQEGVFFSSVASSIAEDLFVGRNEF